MAGAVLTCIAAATSAQAPAPLAGPPAAAVGCLITPHRQADIGTPVAGVVESIQVERGDSVRRGQVLFTLRAEVERANTYSAEVRARNEAAVRGAEANLQAARLKFERTQALREQNFVAQPALEQTRAELGVAEAQLRHSQGQLDSLRADLVPARAQAAQRVVRAPFDGVVVDRLSQPGERVELQPLLRLADVDKLRIEVIVPAGHFGKVAGGQNLVVQPDLPGATARQARVMQIDSFIDAASNTFRVRLELDNAARQVPAGARCRVALDGSAPPVPAAAAAAASLAPPAASTPRAALPIAPPPRPAAQGARLQAAPRGAEYALRIDDSLGIAPGAGARR